MTTISISKTTLALLGVFGVAACGRSGDHQAAEPARTQVASNEEVSRTQSNANGVDENAQSGATSSATEAIAESRCVREQRCENIGADKKYSSMEDCRTRVRNDWRDDLNARECPNGINKVQMGECLDEIRNEDCGNPFDSLSRVAACTVSQICDNGS